MAGLGVYVDDHQCADAHPGSRLALLYMASLTALPRAQFELYIRDKWPAGPAVRGQIDGRRADLTGLNPMASLDQAEIMRQVPLATPLPTWTSH